MDGQTHRDGAWSGHVNQLQVARVYLELRDGTSHPGLFVYSLSEALRLIVEYGLAAPRAFITLDDEIVLEVCDGDLEFPDSAELIFNEYRARFPSWLESWCEPENLGNWLRCRCARLADVAKAHAEASGFDGSVPDSYDHPLNRLEREVQSVAAKHGVNLFAFGFQVPSVVCAELERIASDVSAEEDNVVSGDCETNPVLQDLAKFATEVSSDSVSDPQLGGRSSETFALQRVISSRSVRYMLWFALTKPIRSVLIASLCIAAAGLIYGNDLQDSLMKLATVIMYSAMIVFAMVLYRVLDALGRGPSNSGFDRNQAISPDDLDQHVLRGDRIPRSMDASDPASGSLWIGNHARDELINDHMDHRHR
ncbi:hypothetical protein [Novosphingobium sp. ZW T3_23]|uniref:hypothetical protein n=1 Tax=Novosphingobium sp. ZW T3_23 TaxID=3378084 RepID=UPI003852945A